jgi:hypothetical protein
MLVLGYRINNHNLSRLLNISQMFTNDLKAVFNLADPKSAQLFSLLKHAYVDVRYKDGFQVDTASVSTLYHIAKRFLMISEKVCEKQLMKSTL